MRKFREVVLKRGHQAATNNKGQLGLFRLASCFYCLNTFDVSEIKEWVDDGTTALCPRCGIDAVLPLSFSKDYLPIPDLLAEMHNFWFKDSSEEKMSKDNEFAVGRFQEEDLQFRELQKEAYKNSKEKGFWDENTNIPEKLSLIHSEVSEALEEYRDDHMDLYFVNGKPEGFGIELADAVIRIVDLAEHEGVDLASMIRIKMRYNATRPFKHGGKKA